MSHEEEAAWLRNLTPLIAERPRALAAVHAVEPGSAAYYVSAERYHSACDRLRDALYPEFVPNDEYWGD